MQSQPYTGLSGVARFYSVAPVGGNKQVVAGTEHPWLRFFFEEYGRASAQQYYPLVGVLIVPVAGWATMVERDDTVKTQGSCVEQRVGQLAAGWVIGMNEQIALRNFLH